METGVGLAVIVDEATDASLIARSLDEPELFGKLFDRHAARIHRYAARRVGQGLADDVMAETFLRAFRQRGKYDPSRPDALPWLYGIATNLIRKQRDAEMRIYRLVVKIGIDDEVVSHEEDADSRLSAAAAQPVLAGALASLPRGDRDVLLLTAWADLSYIAIAEALGIPVGTVRSRLSRARRRMRAFLGTDPTNIDEGWDT
jgi:RNA polymerase sigma-70 factor (ECF subfamily)